MGRLIEIEPGMGIYVLEGLERNPEEEEAFLQALRFEIAQSMVALSGILAEIDPEVLKAEYQDLTGDYEEGSLPAPEDDPEPEDPFENERKKKK